MAHVLARMSGVPVENIQRQLTLDADKHAADGMFLEHLWIDFEDPQVVLFLFRVKDLDHCQRKMKQVHAEVRAAHPQAPLPQLTFLTDMENS